MSERYHGYETKRYGIEHAGHDVELTFDKKLLVLNRATLTVDGEPVDDARIVYGDKELSTTLGDGTEIRVLVDSGMAGELTRAQLALPGGGWADLTEREPAR